MTLRHGQGLDWGAPFSSQRPVGANIADIFELPASMCCPEAGICLSAKALLEPVPEVLTGSLTEPNFNGLSAPCVMAATCPQAEGEPVC